MNRKPRKDSKLYNLPADQRARVDKWLFDKGMTYQQVADGCRKLFGLKISTSSVGRYFGTESRRRVAEKGKTSNTEPRTSNFELPQTASPEERWQELLARMTRRALDLATYLTLEWDDEASRELLTITKVLISARRERTDGLMAQLARDKFELWAAREVYRYYVKSLKGDSLQGQRKEKTFNNQHSTFNVQSRSARERNERFREEIQQRVDLAMASEKIREEYKRKCYNGSWALDANGNLQQPTFNTQPPNERPSR